MNNIKQAIDFAKDCLQGQVRRSGRPVIEHILRINSLLQTNNIHDKTTLITAVLHHCVEDENDTNFKKIAEMFGQDVSNLLLNYQKIRRSDFFKENINSLNEKYIYQVFINLANDIRLVVIRIADKYDNLFHSWSLTVQERLDAANNALYLYAPLAKMVGLGKLSSQIEDDAFRITNPRQYFEIKKLRSKKIRSSTRTINDTAQFISQILNERDIENTVTIRFKHIYSVYRKKLLQEMQTGISDNRLDNIYDIIGMRIIVDSIDRCYEVEDILDELWEQDLPQRSDNLINPRSSGYRSLHTYYNISKELGLEIQIRTSQMHEFNEYGPAAHLLYKLGQQVSDDVKEEFSKYVKENPSWFKHLNFWDIQTKIQGYKPIVPFSRYVYVFTPKGDIIQLTRGSKILDFAYSIHTKLGNHCSGCYVNGKFSKLDYTLSDGDLMKIITSNKMTVNRDWLDITFTKKAKNAIRKSLQYDK